MQPDNIISEDRLSAMLPGVFDDIFVYPSTRDTGLFYYLPLNPSPVYTASGNPSGQLMAAGDQSFLMLSVQWDITADRLEQLRAGFTAAIEDDPVLQDSGPVRLAFAPVSDVEAELQVCSEAGESAELARKPTSGMPPYSAMFSMSVEGSNRQSALAAMTGNTGAMFARFHCNFSASVTMEGRFEGDFESIDDSAALKAAMEDGRITFTSESPASAPFIDQFRSRAIELLQLMPDRLGCITLKVQLDFVEPLQITASADIGEWFAAAPAVLPTP